MSIVNVDQYSNPFMIRGAGYKVNKPGLDFIFKRTQLPWTGKFDSEPYVTDHDMIKLEDAMIKDTRAHRHRSFWKDYTSQSLGYLTSAVIFGEGIKVGIDGKIEASQVIEDWNDEINVKHQSIEEFMADVWLDNLIDAQSLWRVYIDKQKRDPEHLVDLQRVPMSSITIQEHPTRGWRRFIQRANVPRKLQTKSAYYRSNSNVFVDKEYAETIIPDEPNCCLFFNFFKTPPVSSILHLLVYKRWITWFMRKFAEKYWAPFILGYVGDPKTGYMPPNKKDQEEAISDTLTALKKIRDFGVGAFLGTTKVETLDTKTQKNANIYVDYLEYLDKAIMIGLHGSIALMEGERQRAENADIVQQGYLRFIRGIRNMFSIKLRKFYARVLLPEYGYNNIKPTDIKINWPPLTLEKIKDMLQAVEIAAKIGVFKDSKEIRKILTPIWPHIDEKISDKEAKEMKNLFLELNSPSRAMGDNPQQRSSGSAPSKGATTNKK